MLDSVVWGVAVEHAKLSKDLILEYLGSAGPLIIGFGFLVAAVGDVVIEDSSIQPVRSYLLYLPYILAAIWFALREHLITKAPPGTLTLCVVVSVATVTLVTSGLLKRDMWRRHHYQGH